MFNTWKKLDIYYNYIERFAHINKTSGLFTRGMNTGEFVYYGWSTNFLLQTKPLFWENLNSNSNSVLFATLNFCPTVHWSLDPVK